MGNYTIVVQGTGQHHNKKQLEGDAALKAAEYDADQIAEKFVQELKAKGHHVHHASITHGGHEHLAGADEDNSHDEKAKV